MSTSFFPCCLALFLLLLLAPNPLSQLLPPPKQGWSSPVMKETPRDNRPPKDFLLSLEGKSCLDLICVGTVEDAKVRAQ